MFEGFKVFSRWPPNHVTDQEEINKLERGPHRECTCKVSPQSVQPFWRRRFFKKKFLKQDGGRNTSSMTSRKTFSTVNLSVDDAQKISDFSHVAFYLTNFHRHTASPMTSRKITPVPHRELSKMYQANFFSIARFQRYRGAKFIAFFKMASAPRDQ